MNLITSMRQETARKAVWHMQEAFRLYELAENNKHHNDYHWRINRANELAKTAELSFKISRRK